MLMRDPRTCNDAPFSPHFLRFGTAEALFTDIHCICQVLLEARSCLYWMATIADEGRQNPRINNTREHKIQFLSFLLYQLVNQRHVSVGPRLVAKLSTLKYRKSRPAMQAHFVRHMLRKNTGHIVTSRALLLATIHCWHMLALMNATNRFEIASKINAQS